MQTTFIRYEVCHSSIEHCSGKCNSFTEKSVELTDCQEHEEPFLSYCRKPYQLESGGFSEVDLHKEM